MIPVTRLIYGRPCPIWLERTAGPLRAASVVVADTARDPHLHLPAGGWAAAGTPPPTDDDCVRACKGGHQGCPLATNQCILPYMLCLHRVQERHRDVDIACLADDTYMHGPPAVLYPAYADKRQAALGPAPEGAPPACELSSNLTKVGAWSPAGDMSLAPPDVRGSARHPDGPIPGFKCVGNYKGDEAWVRRKHEEDMVKRLANLDLIDDFRDTETTQNVLQLRKMLLTDCAALQAPYFARCQRPDRVEPGLRAAQGRLVKPGASAWGTDWIGESKVASPLTKAGPGVGCQDVGHTHAFGAPKDVS